MVTIININNGIIERTSLWASTLWYQSNIDIWWVHQGERMPFICPSCYIWVDCIAYHVDIRTFLPKHEGS